MAFEPFKSAGRSVQVVNAFILLFLFLSWVSTMVTFGSILHKLTIYENNYLEVARFEFYWDRVHITADNIIDDSFGYGPPHHTLDEHGERRGETQTEREEMKGHKTTTATQHSLYTVLCCAVLCSVVRVVALQTIRIFRSWILLSPAAVKEEEMGPSHSPSVHTRDITPPPDIAHLLLNPSSLSLLPPHHCTALHSLHCPCVSPCSRQIFAFLAFLIHLTLTVCRITGLNHPLARDTQHSLYIELVLSCVEWFCFFLTTTIWGGSCYSPSRGLYGGSITGVGYGLMIACFFFLTFNTVMYFLMRSNESLVLGNGASRGGGGGGSGGYEAGGGGEYSSEQQPTFSYQGNGSDSTAL